MPSNTTRRPSPRGRSHARAGRKKLPPIPERSLSSQKASSSTGSSGGGAGAGGLGKNVRAGAVPPTPESRKNVPPMVAAVESRDDEDFPSVSSSVVTDGKQLGGVKPVEDIVVLPPPSRAAAVSTPKETETATVAENELEAHMISDEVSVASSVMSIYKSKARATQTIHEVKLPSSSPRIINTSVKDAMLADKLANATTPFTSNISRKRFTAESEARMISDEVTVASSVISNSKAKARATQTIHEVKRPSTSPRIINTSVKEAMIPDKLVDAITPFTSNISRKRITAVVGFACDDGQAVGSAVRRSEVNTTKYTPEPSWEDFQQARSEAKDGINNDDPPEILSIPTDEIMDSFMKKKKFGKYHDSDNYSNVSDKDIMDYTSRDTRDQYQLGRLQARINRRRELPRVTTNVEDSPNYKTLRSSRIKTARNLYHNTSNNQHQPNDNQEYTLPLSSGASSIHGSIANSRRHSIANSTISTIPSLNHGLSISRSLTSSVSEVQSVSHHSAVQSVSHNSGAESVASPELSEYREKLFAKMLLLLHDLSPDKETLQDDDVSNIKDMVIDEGRASCCSIAELKLIQKLTEEEMSRILNDFEQSNSLIERKETVVYNNSPNFKINEREPPANIHHGNNLRMTMEDNEKEEINSLPMPEKIVYHDNVMSIGSKFSDVTSPTCHDGFELDEILPMHRYPLPRSPRHHKKRSSPSLQPSMSPAAAAAASVAASISLSASGNNANSREHQPHHQLPCVQEIPDTLELNEDNDNVGAKPGKGDPSLVEKEDKERKDSINKMMEASGMAVAEDDVNDSGSPLALVEEVDAREAIESPKDTIRDIPAGMDHTMAQPGEENEGDEEKKKAEEFLASSRETARRTIEEEHFHDGILSAVANASTTADFTKLGEYDAELYAVTSILSQYEDAQDAELDEVTTILSQYEVAHEKAREEAKVPKAPVGVSLPDVLVPPKKVTFLEPLPEVENQPMCGCAIQ